VRLTFPIVLDYRDRTSLDVLSASMARLKSHGPPDSPTTFPVISAFHFERALVQKVRQGRYRPLRDRFNRRIWTHRGILSANREPRFVDCPRHFDCDLPRNSTVDAISETARKAAQRSRG